MRRIGVRVSTFRNFIIHQIFPEFLQPLRDVRTQRVAPFHLGFFFMEYWDFVGLVHNGLPLSIVNISWHRHWRGVTFNSILSFSSLIITYCRWWRRSWRRCRTMTLLRCPWSWLIRTGGRPRWQAWNHDRNEVLRVPLYSNPVFNEMWFLTIHSECHLLVLRLVRGYAAANLSSST